MNNSKKSVIITGANGGIGQELCLQFSSFNYSIIALDMQTEANCIHDIYYQMDLQKYVNDDEVRAKFIQKLEDWNSVSSIHCLINNAAIQIIEEIENLSLWDAKKTYDINLIAPFLMIKDLKNYLEGARGSVVNISSIHARQTKSKFSLYSSSKAALSGLTRALSVELGEKIKINAIEPAAISTSMLEIGFENEPEKLKLLQKLHPSKKLGKPAEVARLAFFIATSDSFLNGACISLDGGIGSCLLDPNN
jgi:NAD(P)-dependent dehydrogenase (short-subunit alcohol dehydrogenase family)